jgi:cell division septation protein DedD
MGHGLDEGGRSRVLLLGLLVVGSVVVFSLGVMVGTKVTVPPQALRNPPAARPAPGPKPPPPREEVPLPAKAPVKSEEMSFYTTLAEPTKPAAPVPSVSVAPIAKIPDPVAPTPEPPRTATPSPAGPGGGAGAGTKAPSPSPSPAPAKAAAPPRGGFSVQVMATANSAEAEAVAARLAKDGFRTFTAPKNTARGIFYTVRVGPAPTEAEAKNLQAEVRRKTVYKDAFLFKE